MQDHGKWDLNNKVALVTGGGRGVGCGIAEELAGRGRFEHDHHWDHDRDRDHGRWHEDNGKHKGWYKKHRDDDRD